ncbi:MAG: hypothetical protein ABSD38_33200 [Syntrophorhabdales bacterium]|jgi:hypothetical protein
MAKRETKVNEDKLQTLLNNWNEKGVSELAAMLKAGESTINYWAGKLRKSMKSNGMSDEQIKKILPAKRRAQGNVYDNVVKRMLSSEEAPKKRGRKSKKV